MVFMRRARRLGLVTGLDDDKLPHHAAILVFEDVAVEHVRPD
jgi:hypothetical protein